MVRDRSWFTRRRIAGVALLGYGAAAAITGLQAIVAAEPDGLGALVAVLGFFVVATGLLFLLLGIAVLRRWLGRAPLAVAAVLSGAICIWVLTAPRQSFAIIGLSFAVTLLAAAALLERRPG